MIHDQKSESCDVTSPQNPLKCFPSLIIISDEQEEKQNYTGHHWYALATVVIQDILKPCRKERHGRET
jgi:hypothetical protein